MGRHRHGALSPRREKFAFEMVNTRNASEAARRAGYANATAAQEGCRIMKDDKVQDRIAEIQAQAMDAAAITPELIAKGLFFEATTAATDSARVTAWKTLAQWKKMVSDRSVGDPAPRPDVETLIENLASEAPGFRPELRAALLAMIPDESGVDLTGEGADWTNVEPLKGTKTPA